MSIPLQGQISARIEQLEGDKAKAASSSRRKKLQKKQDDRKKQLAELNTFEASSATCLPRSKGYVAQKKKTDHKTLEKAGNGEKPYVHNGHG